MAGWRTGSRRGNRRRRPQTPLSTVILGYLVRVLAIVVAFTVVLVLPLRWLPPLTTSFMLQNWAGQLRGQSIRAADIHYDWVSRDAISREAVLAVLAAEDQKFFHHAGFDFGSIRKVLDGAGGRVPSRGASTISQQLAKNLWLWPGRNWLRKGLEAWLTVWLELLLPKERILELYLNVAQFGAHTFGVEAAGRNYFGKAAADLNRAEAALLAAVLPNPVRFSVTEPSDYIRGRQAWITDQAARLASSVPR